MCEPDKAIRIALGERHAEKCAMRKNSVGRFLDCVRSAQRTTTYVAETDVTDVTSYPTNIQAAQLTFALPCYPFLAPCLTAVSKIAVIELDELTFGVQNANHVADTKDLRCEDRPVLLPACVRRFFRSTQTRALEVLLGRPSSLEVSRRCQLRQERRFRQKAFSPTWIRKCRNQAQNAENAGRYSVFLEKLSSGVFLTR